jgi:hypothetical protein
MSKLIFGIVGLLGIAMFANGVFMLAAPETWYYTVPGVGRTGLFNQHFIRDIGILYLFIGGAFFIGVAYEGLRIGLWGAATLWLTCHAIFHLVEVAAGICSASYLVTDFPAVTLPAIIGIVASAWAWASKRREY